MVHKTKVYLAEPPFHTQSVKGVVNSGYWISIQFGLLIQCPEIDAHSQYTLFLMYDEY